MDASSRAARPAGPRAPRPGFKSIAAGARVRVRHAYLGCLSHAQHAAAAAPGTTAARVYYNSWHPPLQHAIHGGGHGPCKMSCTDVHAAPALSTRASLTLEVLRAIWSGLPPGWVEPLAKIDLPVCMHYI